MSSGSSGYSEIRRCPQLILLQSLGQTPSRTCRVLGRSIHLLNTSSSPGHIAVLCHAPGYGGNAPGNKSRTSSSDSSVFPFKLPNNTIFERIECLHRLFSQPYAHLTPVGIRVVHQKQSKWFPHPCQKNQLVRVEGLIRKVIVNPSHLSSPNSFRRSKALLTVPTNKPNTLAIYVGVRPDFGRNFCILQCRA